MEEERVGQGFWLGTGLGLRLAMAHHFGHQLSGLALLNKNCSRVLATL